MTERSYFKTIINNDFLDRKYWIYINVPDEMLDTFITEEQMEELKPEKCYLDSVNEWSQEAIDKLDILLSMPDPDAVTNDDRKQLESALRGLKNDTTRNL